MIKVGLKVWSSNLGYISPIRDLFRRGVFDYIELFVDPKAEKTCLGQWASLEIPFHLHAPHSYAGLNFSQRSMREANRMLVGKVAEYDQELEPQYVIFHPGIDGDLKETVTQMGSCRKEFPSLFKRVLIENKPRSGIKKEICLGCAPGQIKEIIEKVGVGFCLDIAHAICYSVSVRRSWEEVLSDFLKLNPVVYHICDGDLDSEIDQHKHFGEGNFDFKRIFEIVPKKGYWAVETKRDSMKNLDDFERDVAQFRSYGERPVIKTTKA